VCDLPSFLAGEPAEKKPWSTPTVEEIPWDILPTELRMLVLGLPDPEGCYGRAECGQVEKAPREADQAPAPAAARTNGAPPDTNACRDASLHAPAADPAPEPELPDPAATEPQSPQASNGSAVRQAGETEAETEGVPPPTTPQEPQAISKGLSDLRRRELAEQYEDRRYWCSPADIAAGVLDIEMRALLCREISAEQVEIELGRIRATR
jgi:hypothetical protein